MFHRPMSVRTEEVDEIAKKGGIVDELNQIVVLIGGRSVPLSKMLAKVVGRGSSDFQFNLQTKYYTNSVTPMKFSTLAQYNTWKSRNVNTDEYFVGALFAIIENGSDQLLNEFYINKLDVDDLHIPTRAFVINREEDMNPPEQAKCAEWCNLNGFEMVYMHNSEEAVKEAIENREKLGEARLEELLHVVDWPLKKMETTRLTGHLLMDSVLSVLDAMSDSEDEYVVPTEQERDGIYEFLGMGPSSARENGSSSGNGRVAEASVDVNVALKGGVISSVCVLSEADGGRKGKGNKGKANKGNAASKQKKDEGSARSSVETEVTVPVRTPKKNSSIEETIHSSIVEMEDETEEDGKAVPPLASLISSFKEAHNLSKLNGWEEGRMGGVVNVMDRVCKDLMGDESLMEELRKIEKEKEEGTYVENEDSD